MKILCVIPSRIASTRLHRKPLLNIQGKPMIHWVYKNASRCKILDKVVVATDSDEIANVVKGCKCDGKVVMTSPDLPTGTDRVAAVAAEYPDVDIVINLQGDEPFIKPKMLEQLVAPYLEGDNPEMTTLAYKLDMQNEYHSHKVVKVITNLKGDALYFSRSPIPYLNSTDYNTNFSAACRKDKAMGDYQGGEVQLSPLGEPGVHTPGEVKKLISLPVYHHMGIYAFKRDFLLHYTQLPQTPLELAESLEQLRALEHGHRIRVSITEEKTLEVNTPEELAAAQNFQYNPD